MHRRLHCGGAHLKRLTDFTCNAPRSSAMHLRRPARPVPKLTRLGYLTPTICTNPRIPVDSYTSTSPALSNRPSTAVVATP
eukprot:2199909-Pleurochrysis_carterae.AAC.1